MEKQLLYFCVTFVFFFFNDTATTEIYTLSLHDALPIYDPVKGGVGLAAAATVEPVADRLAARGRDRAGAAQLRERSEEHTSELQSRQYLVCRLLLEKKKKTHHYPTLKLLHTKTILSTLF